MCKTGRIFRDVRDSVVNEQDYLGIYNIVLT